MIIPIKSISLIEIGKIMLLNEDRCKQVINRQGGKIDYKLLYKDFMNNCLENKLLIAEKGGEK